MTRRVVIGTYCELKSLLSQKGGIASMLTLSRRLNRIETVVFKASCVVPETEQKTKATNFFYFLRNQPIRKFNAEISQAMKKFFSVLFSMASKLSTRKKFSSFARQVSLTFKSATAFEKDTIKNIAQLNLIRTLKIKLLNSNFSKSEIGTEFKCALENFISSSTDSEPPGQRVGKLPIVFEDAKGSSFKLEKVGGTSFLYGSFYERSKSCLWPMLHLDDKVRWGNLPPATSLLALSCHKCLPVKLVLDLYKNESVFSSMLPLFRIEKGLIELRIYTSHNWFILDRLQENITLLLYMLETKDVSYSFLGFEMDVLGKNTWRFYLDYIHRQFNQKDFPDYFKVDKNETLRIRADDRDYVVELFEYFRSFN